MLWWCGGGGGGVLITAKIKLMASDPESGETNTRQKILCQHLRRTKLTFSGTEINIGHGRGRYVVFLGNTLYFYSASLHPGVGNGYRRNSFCNNAMD